MDSRNPFKDVRATGTKRAPDLAEVRRALAVLADPGHGIELRGLPSGRSYVLPASDVEAVCRAAEALCDDNGVYYTLNPVPSGLGRASKDKDVLARRWLLVDIDPVSMSGSKRIRGVSSTDAEKEAAKEVAFKVMESRDLAGWPLPLIVDSGNGWHLLWRIDLPANDHAKLIIKGVLDAMDHPFKDRGRAEIDVRVFNASRIAKLPGTWARKSEDTKERPHRMCRLFHVPDELVCVTTEQLEAASARPGEEPKEPRQQKPAPSPFSLRATNGPSQAAYARAALGKEVARIKMTEIGDRNNALNRAAFSMAQLVAGGCIAKFEVQAALETAALSVGLELKEASRTIESGFKAGEEKPRVPPERNGHAPHVEVADGEQIIVRASTIEPKKVEWLWPFRIPLGKLTTFAGVGGLGKTFVLCDITARVTQGLPWPDLAGECAERGQVLFISGEDDPDDTLVPRLIELGADLNRVCFLRADVQDNFTLAAVKVLTLALDQIGKDTRLVVIDPPTSYLGGINDHKNSELRALLSPLKTWAQNHRVAMVFNTHVNKGQGSKVEAMMRVMGSVAWVNVVRAAHMFARDPEDETKRLFCCMKINIGKEPKGLAYQIVDGKEEGRARVEWLGEVDVTADQAMNKENRKLRRDIVAKDWLLERFREQRSWPSDELFARAKQEGIGRNAIFEAKILLNLPKAQKHIGPDGAVSWVWAVPSDWAQLSQGQPSANGTLGTVETLDDK